VFETFFKSLSARKPFSLLAVVIEGEVENSVIAICRYRAVKLKESVKSTAAS